MSEAVLTTNIPGLELVNRGKVRDIYAVDDDKLLIVTTDRTSAFDVVMPNGLTGKGKLLTEIALHWFEHFSDIPNHIIESDVSKMPAPICDHADVLAGRSMLVHKAEVFQVECVVRGYIVGSGWKDYQATGSVCGIPLPQGLQLAAKLEEPIFTPATKAEQGEHDENISFERMVEILGQERAEELRDLSLDIYSRAREFAFKRGIHLADTKFEFGLIDGKVALCDEVLTPDSSRFWDVEEYREGISPPSFDKQIVRDWLETLDWDKKAPGPELPQEIIDRTLARYREVISRLKA